MIIINYRDNNFEIGFDLKNHVFEEFIDIIALFKRLFLKFNFTKKIWISNEIKIYEIILFLQKDNVSLFFSDNAEKRLKEIKKENYKSEIFYSRNLIFNKDCVLKRGIFLYDFQEDAINWRLKRSCYLDSFDSGLGKSAININVFSYLYYLNKIKGIIIIPPSGLSYHWKKEILKFTDIFKEDEIQIINNENKITLFKKYQDKKILIIPNHLIATVLLSYRKNFKISKSYKKVRWNRKNINLQKEWNKNNLFLLVDESHEIKNREAIKTKAVHSIRKYFKYVALLSATPAINRIEDFYSQITLLDKSIIPLPENAFKIWISNKIGNRFDKYAITKYDEKKVQELNSSIKHVLTKKLKKDVAEMRSKRIDKEIYLEMHPCQKNLYKVVVENEISILQDEYNHINYRLILNKLPLICEVLDNPLLLKKREYKDDKISSLLKKWKIEIDPKFIVLKTLLSKYVDYLGEKVIVYGTHPSTLDMLNYDFKKYNPLIIHGQIEIRNKEIYRKEIEEIFNEKEENKVLFLSALTSSAGINLNKKCRRIIVYEPPWSGVHYRQLIDRTTRITSTMDSIVEMLYYPDTIDNLRVSRLFARVDLNDKLDKEVSEEELRKLLNGII